LALLDGLDYITYSFSPCRKIPEWFIIELACNKAEEIRNPHPLYRPFDPSLQSPRQSPTPPTQHQFWGFYSNGSLEDFLGSHLERGFFKFLKIDGTVGDFL